MCTVRIFTIMTEITEGELDVVAHSSNPSTGRQKNYEFKASQDYIKTSCLKIQNKKNQHNTKNDRGTGYGTVAGHMSARAVHFHTVYY